MLIRENITIISDFDNIKSSKNRRRVDTKFRYFVLENTKWHTSHGNPSIPRYVWTYSKKIYDSIRMREKYIIFHGKDITDETSGLVPLGTFETTSRTAKKPDFKHAEWTGKGQFGTKDMKSEIKNIRQNSIQLQNFIK